MNMTSLRQAIEEHIAAASDGVHDSTEWWYGAPPMIERLLDRIMGTIQNMMETDET